MTALNAKKGIVEIMIGEAASEVKVKSWSIDTTMGTIDVSTLNSDFKEFLVGQASWSGSLECLYDPTDAAQAQIATDAIAGNLMEMNIYPAGKGDGLPQLTGTALITDWNPGGAVEDAVSLSLSFQGSAALVSSTQTV